MKNKKSWIFLYQHLKKEEWSLPKGFSESLKSIGLNIIDLIFEIEEEIILPSEDFIYAKDVEVLLVFYAGYSEKLNTELIKFKSFPKL